MRDIMQNNAMAEIALALSMGFFSIMVLTMVSMGSGVAQKNAVAFDEAVAIRPSAQAASGNHRTKETIVVYYEGRFLDIGLMPIDLASIQNEGPLVLAVAPGLSFAAVMNAREQVARPDIAVTVLDERWLAVLKEKFK